MVLIVPVLCSGDGGYPSAMHRTTRSALISLVRACDAAGIRLQLGGSGLLFAHELVDRVGDLDLVFDVSARKPLGRLLNDLTGVHPDFAAGQEPDFVSVWRCRHDFEGQPLDLTGGVTVRIGDRPVGLPFTPGRSWDLGEAVVPLAPVEQWWLIYRVHGKPERAAALAGIAGPGVIETMLAGLGIEPADLP